MIRAIRALLARRRPVHHTVCCDDDQALCGTDVTGQPWVPDKPTRNDCAVCAGLLEQPCEPSCDWVAP